MAGKKTLAITDRQYSLLRVLWSSGPLTVRELMSKVPQGDQQPYTTVLGMLQNMEKAGLVTHEKQGVTYRYRPSAGEQETTGKLLRDFLARFFGGSAEKLVLGLVDADELDAADLRELEAKLAAGVAGKSPNAKDKRQTRTRQAKGKRK